MQNKIPSTQLIRAVEFAAKAINDRHQIPILGCVLVEPAENGGLRVTGSNLEMTCVSHCGGRVAGKFAVPKTKLLSFLRHVGLGVDIDVDLIEAGKLQITGAGGKATVPVLPAAEYPELPKAPEGEFCKHNNNLAVGLAFAAGGCEPTSKDMVCTVVNAVVSGDIVECFGTDRRSVFVFNGQPEAPFDATGVIIQQRHIQPITELLLKPGSRCVASNNMFFVVAGDDTISTKLVEVGLPDPRPFLKELKLIGKADVDELLVAFNAANALKTETEFAAVLFNASVDGMVSTLDLDCATTAGSFSRKVHFKPEPGAPALGLKIDARRAIDALATMVAEVQVLCIPGIAIAFRRGEKTAFVSVIRQ